MSTRFHLSRSAECSKRSLLTGECMGHFETSKEFSRAFACYSANDFVVSNPPPNPPNTREHLAPLPAVVVGDATRNR